MFIFISRWRFIAAAFVLSVSSMPPAASQDHRHHEEGSRYITLDEIIEQTEAQNPALRAARLNAEAIGTVAAQVSAWPDPTIGIGYEPFPMLTAHGAQRSQWSLEQRVPYPGKLSLREEIAVLEAKAASYDSEAVLDALILQAKEAYYELYRLNELERLIRHFETNLAGYEEAAAVRYEVGKGPQQALLKAQLEKNQLTQRLHHVESARRRAAEWLARLTNHPDGPRHFLVAEPVLAATDPYEAVALTETALEERPEFAALEAAAERTARQVELARKEAYPDIELRITYFDIAARDVPPTATGRDALAIGASITIPLQRSRISAQIKEARLRQAQVEASKEALRTEYRTQIEELLAALDHEALAIEEYETILLPQAATTIEATLSAYSTGTADFLDMLDAERTIFEVRTGYVDAVVRHLIFSAHLERVLGVRSLEELSSVASNDITIPEPLNITENE